MATVAPVPIPVDRPAVVPMAPIPVSRPGILKPRVAPPINKGPLLKPDQIVALVVTGTVLSAIFVMILALLGVFDGKSDGVNLVPIDATKTNKVHTLAPANANATPISTN